MELGLFRIRSFAAANAGTVVFAIGFYALLLCNVLFVTGVWGYSILRAGAALTPGAVMAALVAPVAGRLADRYGQRALALPGGLIFAGGTGWLVVVTTSAQAMRGTCCRGWCSPAPGSACRSPRSAPRRWPSYPGSASPPAAP